MYGAALPLFRKGVNHIMLSSLMIIPDSLGFILCLLVVNFFLFINSLPL
uniref:Uncharacterized protein n=1 Tax=Arundo donax TaxID=35708 RepID=A0A0A8YM05_ARUDO